MKITDGKNTVEVRLHIWKNESMSEDMSNDFFEAGGLPINDDGAYVVEDVDHCIAQADDWKNYRGDFYDEEAEEYDRESEIERIVFVC